MQGRLIPVTLVLGFSSAANATLLQVLQTLQTADARWAWLLQDLNTEPGANRVESPGSRMQLSSACICCVGQAELQTRLPKLLRAGPWKRIVIELAAGSHPSRVIDFLRSKSWNTKLDIQQVLLAIDSETLGRYFSAFARPALNEPAAQILARAQLMSSTHLIALRFDESLQVRLRAAISEYDLLENLQLVVLDQRTLAAQLALELTEPTSANQAARTHTSCNLRTDESNTLHFDVRWSPSRLFDRRRVIAVINSFALAQALADARAVFATERAWYEWRTTDSTGLWSATEYRVCSFLRIRASDSIELRERLRDLQIAIEHTIVN